MGAVHKIDRKENKPEGLAVQIARSILAGFDRHYSLFRDASRQARCHFETGDWPAMRALARERIEMYDRRVEEAVRGILDRFPEA